MSTSSLPAHLKHCPIVDCVVELRFTTAVVPEATFGMLYPLLRSAFPQFQELPAAQFPKVMPGLAFQPLYRLANDKYSCQIGSNVVTVSPNLMDDTEYPGWSSYFPVVENVFSRLLESKIVNTISRLGIRYTNFFPKMDIYPRLIGKIDLGRLPMTYTKTLLKTEIASGDDFWNIVQVSNDAQRTTSGGQIPGSIIDVDTYKLYSGMLSLPEILADVTKGHDFEKNVFWNLLDSKFQAELEPDFQVS